MPHLCFNGFVFNANAMSKYFPLRILCGSKELSPFEERFPTFSVLVKGEQTRRFLPQKILPAFRRDFFLRFSVSALKSANLRREKKNQAELALQFGQQLRKSRKFRLCLRAKISTKCGISVDNPITHSCKLIIRHRRKIVKIRSFFMAICSFFFVFSAFSPSGLWIVLVFSP